MDRAVPAVPHPFLLPTCCLPKPIPTPRALYGPFPYIPSSAPARPGANLREPGPPSLAPSTRHVSTAAGWSHKMPPAGWDLSHVGRSLARKTDSSRRGEEDGE
ncbi:putative transcriptional regulator ERG-like [Scophthalmus maximus]|nr:putative transcriptional regulator ERG-like [Scophthalmus maximus]